jgi:hypothetical protein
VFTLVADACREQMNADRLHATRRLEAVVPNRPRKTTQLIGVRALPFTDVVEHSLVELRTGACFSVAARSLSNPDHVFAFIREDGRAVGVGTAALASSPTQAA